MSNFEGMNNVQVAIIPQGTVINGNIEIAGKLEMYGTINGDINSNYGWMIWSKENGSQYNNCIWHLTNDPVTRNAVMIYTRPSMHVDATSNHKHDFCCTHYVHCFLNKHEDGYILKYIVYQRSQDAVFGYNNDVLWHMHVRDRMLNDLSERLGINVKKGIINYNCGSLHVYERHFKFLD